MMKQPKILKRHKKSSDNRVRRTCWRSIKWKIAILCCSTQSRKGGGCNNIFLMVFLLSQVYLLHRFGVHRKDQLITELTPKRSYPIHAQNVPPPLPQAQPYGKLQFQPQAAQQQAAPPAPPAKSVQEFVGKKAPLQVVQSASQIITSSSTTKSTTKSTSRPASSTTEEIVDGTESEVEKEDETNTNYADVQYEYNVNLLGATMNKPLPSDSAELEDLDMDEDTEPENPGDAYLNEDSDDGEVDESAAANGHASLTSIFFDIPDPASYAPDQCHVLTEPEKPVKVTYQTDQTKFLVPLLPWGPVEQMRGFREALLMSLYLNRTLCVPPFWKEKSELGVKSLGDGLPGAARFDVGELNKIIKLCPTEMIRSHCGETFHSLMLGQNICSKYNQKRLDELHQRLSMKSVYTDDKCSLADDVKQFPPGFKGKMVKVPIERDQVLELFPDDSKCTLYLYPYINFIDSEKKLLVPFLTKNAPIEGQWLKDIVTHTPRPKYILNIADKFMASLGLEKKNFVAIHWNFEKDYEDACNKKQGDVFCELAGNSTAAYKVLIKHVKLHNQKAKLKAIFFSASMKTLSTVLPELEPLWKAEFDGLIKIITRNDVKPFVEDNGCIGVPTEDSLETAQMELCYRASAFLRAQYSIWSRTIDFERRANRQRTLSDKLFTDVINLYK